MSIEQMILPIVVAAVSAVSIALIYGIRILCAMVKMRTHNQFVGYILHVVETLAAKVVAEVAQSYVEPLKKQGEWNAQSAHIAADKALATFKSYLGPDGLGKVASILGAGAETEGFLRTYLESAVAGSKPPGMFAPVPPTPPIPESLPVQASPIIAPNPA